MCLPPNILAVLLVPLRAAPCFHILSAAACQSAVVGETAHSPLSLCACVQMAFLHTLLSPLFLSVCLTVQSNCLLGRLHV